MMDEGVKAILLEGVIVVEEEDRAQKLRGNGGVSSVPRCAG